MYGTFKAIIKIGIKGLFDSLNSTIIWYAHFTLGCNAYVLLIWSIVMDKK